MSKSLLEVETARKRLEELDQQRATFLDLIKKLKGIRDAVEPLLDRLKQSEAEIATQKKEIEHLISSAKNTISDFENLTKKLINDLGTKTDAIISNASTNISHLRKAFIEFSDKKAEEMNEVINGIKSDFNQLKDEQIENLDQISKAYERMRTSYDAMKNLVDSIDLSITTIRKDLESNQATVNDIRISIEKIDNNLLDINQKTENLFAQNNTEINITNNRLDEIAKLIKELELTDRGGWVCLDNLKQFLSDKLLRFMPLPLSAVV